MAHVIGTIVPGNPPCSTGVGSPSFTAFKRKPSRQRPASAFAKQQQCRDLPPVQRICQRGPDRESRWVAVDDQHLVPSGGLRKHAQVSSTERSLSERLEGNAPDTKLFFFEKKSVIFLWPHGSGAGTKPGTGLWLNPIQTKHKTQQNNRGKKPHDSRGGENTVIAADIQVSEGKLKFSGLLFALFRVQWLDSTISDSQNVNHQIIVGVAVSENKNLSNLMKMTIFMVVVVLQKNAY